MREDCPSFNPIVESSHSRPEKQQLFPYFPHFIQNRTLQKVFTAYRSPIYQIKADKMNFQVQKKLFLLIDRYSWVEILILALNFGVNLREFGKTLEKYCILDGRF